MTYYKHVKREANSQVNWAEVGKKISDSLIQVRDEREKRKSEIDEASRQFGEQLANAPQGENQEMNEFINDAARDTAELRRIQDNLLRSGMMKMRDYSRSRQNLTDGWNNFAKLGEEYNTEWAEKMARAQNGEGSLQELYEMEQIEGFANFTEAKMYIDPMTGKISLGHRVQGEDGTYGADIDMEKPLMTINEMRERLKRKINRYDVIGGLTPVVNALGQNVEVLRRAGIETIDDITGRELSDDQREALGLFRSAQENALNSILSSPDVASSIMSDYVNVVDGEQVRFTTNEEELSEGNHVMLLKRNEKSGDLFFEPTEEQRGILFNALRDQMDIMLDIKETPMARDFQAERENREKAKGFEEQVTTMTSIAQLWGGSESEVRSAGKSLKNMPTVRGRIREIVRTPNGVEVFYLDDETNKVESQPFEFKEGGVILPQKEFIESIASFFGIENIEEALSKSRYNPDAVFNNKTDFATGIKVYDTPEFDEQTALIGSSVATLTELFDEIDENDLTTATTAISEGFKGLPDGLKLGTNNLIIDVDPSGWPLDEKKVAQIFLPKVMTLPFFVPEGQGAGLVLKNVMQAIYKRAQEIDAKPEGEMPLITPEELQQYITEVGEGNWYSDTVEYQKEALRMFFENNGLNQPESTTTQAPAPSGSTTTNKALPPNPNGIGSKYPIQNNTN